jgi:hypothetical protein
VRSYLSKKKPGHKKDGMKWFYLCESQTHRNRSMMKVARARRRGKWTVV